MIMRMMCRAFLTAALLLISLSMSAQRSGSTKDPTLNRGEGLEMTRSDLDKMRNQNRDKNSKKVDIYMFGASFSILDSVLYVSYTQKMDSVTVNNRWFLKDRASFEKQFTSFVEGREDGTHMSTVYYSDKLKTIEKRRERLINRNARRNGFKLKQVPEFRFTNNIPE